jgi:hypothetical protein
MSGRVFSCQYLMWKVRVHCFELNIAAVRYTASKWSSKVATLQMLRHSQYRNWNLSC